MMLDSLVKNGSHSQLAGFLKDHTCIDEDELANALSVAVLRENLPIVKLLLEHGANPNVRPSRHMPALHCAVEQQSAELVRQLFDCSADINWPNENGFTPLHLAVDIEADDAWQRGESPTGDLIALLLELGANPKATDAAGTTPLDIAERYEFKRAIQLLTGEKKLRRQ